MGSQRNRRAPPAAPTPTATPAPGSQGERLQKLLAAGGLGSRRQIEQWIRAGRVALNGVTAMLGARALPGAEIRLDGQPVRLSGLAQGPAAHAGTPVGSPAVREVLLYHKPLGEVTTRSDPQGRPTVFDRLPPPRGGGRWVVIGRLDVNTTGLLLFTTDGQLAHRWMHPSGQIEREYLVRLRGQPSVADLARLRRGILLQDGVAHFERIEGLREQHPVGENVLAGSHAWFRVALREGRKREVRRLWEAAGYEVTRLKRVRYGSVRLPERLPPGQWRWLAAEEAGRL